LDAEDARIRTLEQAAAWIEGLVNYERRPTFRYDRLGLAAVRALLGRLGDPQEALGVLHFAGSKGKGSAALFAESLLGALGVRTGTFTSPHLESWTERFRVAGCPVEGAELAAAMEQVRGPVEALRAEGDPSRAPTFFDAATAAACVLFRRAGVERAILEVGLGGRLDSTNAVRHPAVTAITSIELEHTDKLGTDLASIAGEKAGIAKPGVPLVAGLLPDEALAVVRETARRVDAPLWEPGAGYRAEVRELPGPPGEGGGVRLAYRDEGGCAFEADLPLLGVHQGANAALAVAAVRRLPEGGAAAVAGAAPAALAATRLPGRLEVVGRRPWRIVDAAHTAVSARFLADVLERFPARRRHLVLSVSQGKNLDAILAALLPGAARVTVTRAEPHRSLDPAEIAAAARAARPDCEVRVVPNPHLALRAAHEGLEEDDLLCATGSVYLAGLARRLLQGAPRPVTVSRRGPATGPGTPRP